MSHPAVLDKNQTALVVVDMQEAFRKAIPAFAEIASRITQMIRGCQILGVPIIVTEQYPKGLGKTAEEILFSLPDDFEFIEKTAFSSCGALAFTEKLEAARAKQILVCGIDTHICVNQTAHDLLAGSYQVHVLTDCVGSRFEHDKQAAIQKLTLNGAFPSGVEMALFELLRDSKHEQFKEIQYLIK
ncbi:MAG TPA: isochorismatase family protein [Pyrinomonadaceae bacterium]|nr:isochorismatase family protein [Pyrinomonadaceae bacterium]